MKKKNEWTREQMPGMKPTDDGAAREPQQDHDNDCERELTSHGYTECRCDERGTRSMACIADIVKPTDTSDEAIRRAALSTASRLGLFAKTWPEFYAFGLAVKAHSAAELAAAHARIVVLETSVDYLRYLIDHPVTNPPVKEPVKINAGIDWDYERSRCWTQPKDEK